MPSQVIKVKSVETFALIIPVKRSLWLSPKTEIRRSRVYKLLTPLRDYPLKSC